MRFFRALGRIQAITFDLDDTLYDNAPIIRGAEQVLNAHLQQHYPRTAQLTAAQWRDIRQHHLKAQPALRSDMAALRLLILTTALEADIADAVLRQQAAQSCFEVFYQARSDFSLSPATHRLLASLAQKVPLIAITNGNVDTQAIGIHGYFQAVLHASVDQPMKPDPCMFLRACERLKLPPREVLHVGDHLIKDVQGAANVGMYTAWHACNRTMNIRHEPVSVLPHVVLDALDELLSLV